MRLGNRRPNTGIRFVDQSNGEVLLRVAVDSKCFPQFEFHLYDASGALVADSNGLESFPDGLTVRSDVDEVLLSIPPEMVGALQYRLYSSQGRLLTCSDGVRTQIYAFLGMESEVPRHASNGKR